MDGVEAYAMKILVDHGCDCYTYGGEFSEKVLDDLKTEYPNGMKFPYVDVANAILGMSRPRPIVREEYRVRWEMDNCCDSYPTTSLERGKGEALDTLLEWMAEEMSEWCGEYLDPGWSGTPTDEQKEHWDYMIWNCGVSVAKYNPQTDEYEDVWSPSDDDLKEIGWDLYDNLSW